MKKRIDYKSKKFVITAALILIVSIAAIAGTVSFIRSNNDSEAVSDGEIENVVQNENDAVNDLDDSTSNAVGDEDGDGIVDSTSATSDRNNFSSLQTTTITEYKDVEKVTSKSKMIGWAPNALNINIDNSIGVNKTRIEVSKEFTSYIDMSEEVIENEEIEENDKEIIEGDVLPTQTENDVVYGVEKEATEDTKVDLHDVLTYTVTIKNTGNLPVHNVEVVDTIVFDENGELVVKTIEEILPGESKSVTFEYVVVEEDILNGEIVNSAIATIEGKIPTELDEPVIVPTEDINKDYTVTKELVTVNGETEIPEKVYLNDVLVYEIVVTNIGNVTLENILVEDSLEGAVLLEGVENPIEKLAPGEEQSVLFGYTVIETDVEAGKVVNSAVVTTEDKKEEPEEDVVTPVNQDYKYTVKYLEKDTLAVLAEEKDVDSTYGTEITSADEVIEIDGYYYDSTNVETLVVGVDESKNIIEIYYTKRADLRYTVNYLEKDTNVVIKDAKTVENQVFMTVIESSSEIIDIEGYNYDSLNPESITIVTDETLNVINLYYTKRTDLSYEVNYLEKDTNVVLAEQKVVTGQTFKSTVSENAIDITGYDKVAPTSATITIEVTGNVINFYYTKRTDLSYEVNYLEKDTNKVLADQKVVNGQTYKSSVTENAIEISGYDKVEPTTETITIEVIGNVINFYYTKRTDLVYEVNYLEKDTNKVLADKKVVTSQTYKSEVTENAIDISGYDKVAPTSETITIEVEDNVINFYYTKRTDLSYEVNYLEKGTNEVLAPQKVVNNQTYKSSVTENAIDISGYDKVAPTSETITIEVEDNVINFYYTKRTDLSYEVNYLEKDTNKVLADKKVVDGQTYKDTVTENAIDISGYDKVAPTTATITIEVEDNVINFYYTKRTDLVYEVNYLEKDTNKVLADKKVVDGQTYKDTVTENAIDITGYDKVAPTTKSITIEVENNVINFYYTKRTDLSYEVNYLEQGTDAVLAIKKVVNGQTYKDTVTENAIDISGYDKVAPTTATITIEVENNVINFYYTKRTDLVYEVNYLEKGTNAVLAPQKVVTGQTYKDTVTENAIDISGYDKVEPTTETITIEVTGNVINFYYTKRTDLVYEVNYLEKDTNKVLADKKVVDGQTYKDTVTENAIDISGYDKVAPTSATITIEVTGNVINFYYTKRTDLAYEVNYLEKDTNAVLAPQKVVTGQTYKASVTENAIEISGYDKVEPTTETITIEVTGNVINFYYTKRTDLVYEVNYLEIQTEKVLAPQKVVTGQTYKDEVTEQAIDISGYDKVDPTTKTITIEVTGNVINFYYMKRDDLTYVVNYLEEGTNLPLAKSKVETNQVYGSEVTEDAIDIAGYNKVKPTTKSITIGVDENVINFYYTKRKDLAYEVNYLEQGTNEVLAPQKVVTGQTYEAEVTERAIEISGYDKVDPTTVTITIDVENNVINFYYTKRTDLSYEVNYLEKDTNAVLADKKVVDGQTYKDTVTENAIEISGYDKVEPTTETITIEVTGNVINFYYTKRTDLSYIVNYLEKDTNVVLADAKIVDGQEFGSEVTENAIDISGYDKVDPTTATITIAVNIEDNVINFYYTKRTDLSYEVNYLEKDTNAVLAPQKVVNGQTYKDTVTENAIEISGYDKVEPTTETITIEVTGNVINFYYTKRTDLVYEVNYLEKDTNAVLAEKKVVTGQIYKDTVTENAIEISGYDKVAPTTATITIEVENNVINFYYTKRTDLSYEVNYLEKDTNAVLAEKKVVTGQTYKDTVTENAIEISGYDKVEPTTETITIEVTGNVINFYYTKRTDLVYEVNYLEKDTNAVLAGKKVVTGQTYKDTVTENAIDISGYDKVAPTSATITIEVTGNVINFYYTKRTDLSYEVNYLEKDTNAVLAPQKVVNGQTYKDEVTEQAIDIAGYDKVAPTSETITIEVTGNVINFYYTKRTDLSYTVNYLEKGTNAVLAPQKVVNGQTYKDEVTEQAIDITNYNKENPTSATIVIELTGNVINFYYTKATSSYTVNYLEVGTNKVLRTAKVVEDVNVGTVITSSNEVVDIDGYGFHSTDKATLTVTRDATNNVINIYYEAINVTLTKMAVDSNGNEVLPLHKFEEGDIVRFKLSVKNNGSTTVKNYTVTDVLPSELSFYGTQPTGTTVNGNTLTWTINDLAAGATANITVVTKVNNDSWSSSPQDTYHSRDGVMLANGTETKIRKSSYRGDTKTKYDNDENYINASFHLYNSQRGEVPFENGNTQYEGGYTTVGFGRVKGAAYNSALTSIEDLNSVIDTHNIVQDYIVYAPNYNPGTGKIVLWYVSKIQQYNGWDLSSDETYNGETAYIRYHVDGIVVDLNNVYAVTNRITGSNGSVSDDMVLVLDDSTTSTGITTNDTVRPATASATTRAVNPFANIDNTESIVVSSNTMTNTVTNTVENTVIENVVENKVEDEVIENTVVENVVVEEVETVQNEVVENVIEEVVTEEVIEEEVVNEIVEVIETEPEIIEPVTEDVTLPNTELKETEGEATV